MPNAEIVVTGLPLGEGPAELADGQWAVTGVSDGRIWRVDPQAGTAAPWADTSGGPNSAVATADGGLVVAQNGGIDMREIPGLEHLPAPRFTEPGLQRVHPDGSVSTLATGWIRPNDTVVAADGTVWLTDTGGWPPTGRPEGCIRRYHPDGSADVWTTGFTFSNGLAQEPRGSWLVTEGEGLMRVYGPGPTEREWVVEKLPSPGDGLCMDEQGNAYLAGTSDGVVRVVSPAGEIVETLTPPVSGIVTDCAFTGPERRTLVACVAHPGVLVAWENMPVRGQQLHLAPA